jgi:hypothetical protein
MRKFTDIVGKREPLYKSYIGSSPHIIIGYMLPYSELANWSSNRGNAHVLKYEQEERGTRTSNDGFFEIHVDNDYETYQMIISPTGSHRVHTAVQANTWIFVVKKPTNKA